ncbi:DNA-3-methyladenine glycosylase I [Marinicella rhabdoformis]|uniref:DNA-3-methyladenine glycosylase I n=1 Tax=Marinicella rhabdoformis TaxID=2580566 RepID=UPI0012AEBA9E|nr:DNA-3-methyladenine glycosylase I [Marinicella rhabdoformis]
MKKRCGWAENQDENYQAYHDEEWGVPVKDDRVWFEFLTLEGAQAGLSWATILNKRKGYRKAFVDFDYKKVAEFSEEKIQALREDASIVRNQLKIRSTVGNAKALITVQKEFGSFNDYIWQFVGGKPIVNQWKDMSEVPVSTVESDAMSKDLKKRGFKFVGTTICYALMQATGMVNDHTTDCFCYPNLREK